VWPLLLLVLEGCLLSMWGQPSKTGGCCDPCHWALASCCLYSIQVASSYLRICIIPGTLRPVKVFCIFIWYNIADQAVILVQQL
jgi:hypothetical protein